MGKRIIATDYVGKKYGRLTVISVYTRDLNGHRDSVAACACECGNTYEAKISHLKYGNIKSCGCLKLELGRKFNYRHGNSGLRLHHIWRGMVSRCTNPNDIKYEKYGRLGLTVCDEWKNNFESFMRWSLSNGYDDTLTIDRMDNDLGYSPENCRWVDMVVQNRNQRIRPNNTTGVRGVSYEQGKYRVRIRVNGTRISIGQFNTLEEATKAREEAELKYW